MPIAGYARVFLVVLLILLSGCAVKRTDASSEALRLMNERCKRSGYFVSEVARGVEGILLMNVRPPTGRDIGQFDMEDPYGFDATGDAYIKSFLGGRSESIDGRFDARVGYRYVDVIEDGIRYRYRGYFGPFSEGRTTRSSIVLPFLMLREKADGDMPRYGVVFEDISTVEERTHWIAGSSLKIFDLVGNKVIAERVGYMFDSGAGNRVNGRNPWVAAASNSCPSFYLGSSAASIPAFAAQLFQTRRFVQSVLAPSYLESNPALRVTVP